MLRMTWYGDDFTGASDTLATLAAAGLRALLFTQVPTAEQLERAGPLDALGIAGTARALALDAMREELAPVARLFDDLSAPVTHYKCCSTFDSAVHTGNLVLGTQALHRPRHLSRVPVVGGQPSLGRYCSFGHLFATASAAGEVYRIDRHPTMSRHPVTPMHEADLRLHLQHLGWPSMGSIDWRALDSLDDAELDTLWQNGMPDSAQAVLLDVTTQSHLARIGRLLWQQANRQPLLTLGASSVAQALILHWQGASTGNTQHADVPASEGPVFLMVGSLSPVTAAQVTFASQDYACVPLPLDMLLGDESQLDALARSCAGPLRAGQHVLSQTQGKGSATAPTLQVAAACARLLGKVLHLAPEVMRVGIAGGDTSSFSLRALMPWALSWKGTLAAGVPLLQIHADDPRINGLELMLKGGQMGGSDVFRRLVKGHSPLRSE